MLRRALTLAILLRRELFLLLLDQHRMLKALEIVEQQWAYKATSAYATV